MLQTLETLCDSDAALSEKLNKLKGILAKMGRVAVAFSGGVDSSLLAQLAHELLGENMMTITLVGHAMTEADRTRAHEFCADRGIAAYELPFNELSIPAFAHNAADRCYHCKHAIFSAMIEEAEKIGGFLVIDGSNTDDESDYRPGMRALAELGVRSPLKEAGLSKADVRALSRAFGLPTWNLPSAACLASRIAYGEAITQEKLRRVEAAEAFLHELGLSQMRVRVHGERGTLARIEVDTSKIEELASEEMRARLLDGFKACGFTYVCLDLEGFRSGSMNEELSKSKKEEGA